MIGAVRIKGVMHFSHPVEAIRVHSKTKFDELFLLDEIAVFALTKLCGFANPIPACNLFFSQVGIVVDTS